MKNSVLACGTGTLMVAVLLLAGCDNTDQVDNSLALPAPQSIRLELGDASLEAWAWGDPGDDLVLALPGSGSNNSRYRELGALVSQAGYRFVAINQRGIEGSSGNLEGLTLHDYAADVAAAMDYLGKEKAHLVGWALGNRIQRMVATDYPDKVASVTLLAAGGLVAPTFPDDALQKLLDDPDLSLEEKILLSRQTLFSPQAPDTMVREFASSMDYFPAARTSQQRANAAVPRDLWWAGGTSPMLIIQGLDDTTAPVGNGRQMQETYGDRVTLVEIEGAGHLMGFEKPHETAAAIIDFLARHPIHE